MPRTKSSKSIDLDDDYYSGEDDYEGEGATEEDISPEDREQLRLGAIKVREALPPGARHVTQKQIEESLWYYYYDVDKSVAYLVEKFGQRPEKTTPQKGPKNHKELAFLEIAVLLDSCSNASQWASFFQDTPWLNIPTERRGNFIAPLYPRGGLLGGLPGEAPKLSKLQALAAERKRKKQEQKESGSLEVEKPIASLNLKKDTKTQEGKLPAKDSARSSSSQPIQTRLEQRVADGADHEDKADQAEPSAFASTVFNTIPPAISRQSTDSYFTLPYVTATASLLTDPFAEPSPDDVVIAAQTKANGGGKEPAKTTKQKKADQIAKAVENIKLDDTPTARSKNLDVLVEFEKSKMKNAANFVVIGHVDAGKSTLMGRLLFDLKVVNQRTIERYRTEAEKLGKSSFALAWVLDQGSEERARGVTIDIATNHFETENTSFTILDAPGHQDFIPNMIAGASQADFAVLVVDASTGSFESGMKGQTKEHALLVRSMGVQRIIVAVNKFDMASWSEERFTEISTQIRAFLTSAGFQERNVSFVPVSGLLGDNIARKSTDPAASWYKGPTLVEELDSSKPITRALTKPLRLTIGDIFRGGVQNPLSVSGRIEAGSLQVGDALLAQPAKEKCVVKSLEMDNEVRGWAVAGQNVTLHLSDIDPIHLKVGDVLCSPSSPITPVKELTAKVLAFDFLTPMHVDVHRGRLHVPGKIKEIVAVLDKTTGVIIGKKKPKIVKPNQVARVVVELESAVPLEAPWRIVLRASGETVAAGLLE